MTSELTEGGHSDARLRYFMQNKQTQTDNETTHNDMTLCTYIN